MLNKPPDIVDVLQAKAAYVDACKGAYSLVEHYQKKIKILENMIERKWWQDAQLLEARQAINALVLLTENSRTVEAYMTHHEVELYRDIGQIAEENLAFLQAQQKRIDRFKQENAELKIQIEEITDLFLSL